MGKGKGEIGKGGVERKRREEADSQSGRCGGEGRGAVRGAGRGAERMDQREGGVEGARGEVRDRGSRGSGSYHMYTRDGGTKLRQNQESEEKPRRTKAHGKRKGR